jgi:hypothetical protein
MLEYRQYRLRLLRVIQLNLVLARKILEKYSNGAKKEMFFTCNNRRRFSADEDLFSLNDKNRLNV